MRDVAAALAALGETPADLLIVDREPGGLDARAVCRALRADPRLGGAWLLAITVPARPGAADDALSAGADDYLHRPFTRAQLLARAEAGLRAAQQRADDALLRTLMLNVPGAIYRSAWHAGHTLELISDEIERISGYPPANFIASERRTIMSIIHPDDRDAVRRAVATATDHERPFVIEYRIVRADGEIRWVLDRGQLVPGPGGRLWMDGAIFDVTERREAEEALRRREIEAARTAELRASRARIVAARTPRGGGSSATCTTARSSGSSRSRSRCGWRAGASPRTPESADAFLEHLGDELSEASAELRELARGIHPAVLTDRGLAPAVEALATRTPVPVDIVCVPEDRLPATAEATAYFTVSEALTNVAKYARASHASVRVACEDGTLVVEVRDDGVGGAEASTGSGLSGLSDRVGALDGSLSVTSPPGEGTLVRAVLPLAEVTSGA